jgi:hypothetical protein
MQEKGVKNKTTKTNESIGTDVLRMFGVVNYTVFSSASILALCEIGRKILKEQTRSVFTTIIAPALSNSPQ